MVLVDDVQWVDDPLLAWLGYLARRVGDLPLVLVVGLRSGDPGAERVELAQLGGDGVARVALAPLSAAAVETMVRARLDERAAEEFCGEIYELTHGNPLFVAELLMAAREEGLVARGESVPATLERSQSPLELARALADYGAALRRSGRRVQARAELERALNLAHRCGARRIANQARAELVAAGAKPRRDPITGRDALTAGELRVARLAAEGLTNREIAQALFITTKTAKAHLNRVYRKLEITRRGQLAGGLSGVSDDSREQPSASMTPIP